MIIVDILYVSALLERNKEAKYEFSNDYSVFTISNDEVKVEISGYRITKNENAECDEPMLVCDVDNLLDLRISVLSICNKQIQFQINRYFLKAIKHLVEVKTDDYAEQLREELEK